MNNKNPTHFKCIEFDPQTCALSLSSRVIPQPKANEVLVRVWGSPINPSDRLFCQGLYGTKASRPVVPGFEGSGTVVKTGSSWMARRLLGKRVSGAVQGTDGFWAEHVLLPASQCLPVSKGPLGLGSFRALAKKTGFIFCANGSCKPVGKNGPPTFQKVPRSGNPRCAPARFGRST
ncbi:hypothetical protein EBT16_10205 [bacterium]|nr:hypothetical protein [bacterium]